MKIKMDRLSELVRFGFEESEKFYFKKFRAIEVNVQKSSGSLFLVITHFIHENYLEDITTLSNQMMADRHDVDMLGYIFEEKEMLENE